MIFKITVDAGNTIDALKNFGVTDIPRINHIFVDADDPDGACYLSIEKFKDKVTKNKITEELIDFLEDSLLDEIKVTKLTIVRPHL
tara:strand:- start:2306 stop:2563 length:258 start_codon:yes stop_codon:yes gene_type:complete